MFALERLLSYMRQRVPEQAAVENQRQTNAFVEETIKTLRDNPNLEFSLDLDYIPWQKIWYTTRPRFLGRDNFFYYTEQYYNPCELDRHINAEELRARAILRRVEIQRVRGPYQSGSTVDVILVNNGSRRRPKWNVEKAEQGQNAVQQVVESYLSELDPHPAFGRRFELRTVAKVINKPVSQAQNLAETRELTALALQGI